MASRTVFLRERVKHIAAGFYVERDGGDWYAVNPFDQRIAESFKDQDDARRFILWLAGDPIPDGWRLTRRSDLFCELDCGQVSPATIWTKEACGSFPARAAEIFF